MRTKQCVLCGQPFSPNDGPAVSHGSEWVVSPACLKCTIDMPNEVARLRKAVQELQSRSRGEAPPALQT